MSFISVTGNLDNQLNISSKTFFFFFIFMLFYLLCFPNAGNPYGSKMTGCESVLVMFFYMFIMGMKKRKEKWTKEL